MRSEFSECVMLPTGVGGSMVPLADVSTSVFVCNPSTGADSGSAVTGYEDRTSNIAADMTTDESGTVSYYLDPGDYNIHFTDTHGPPRFTSYVRAFTSLTSGIAADFTSLQASFLNLEARKIIQHGVESFGTQVVSSTTYNNYSDVIIISPHIDGPATVGIWYDAIWSETVLGQSRAAIWLWTNFGGNQLVVAGDSSASNYQTQAAARGTSGTANNWGKLTTCPIGLASYSSSVASFSGDTATGHGQAIANALPSNPITYELGNAGVITSTTSPQTLGGAFWVNIPPGTNLQEVDIQFKVVSSGSLSVKNRILRVTVLPF